MPEKLNPAQLRKITQLDDIGCESSDQVKPLESIIGQERAVKALQFGLNIKSPGYNIFVSGQTGTGRTSAAKRYLDTLAGKQEVPDDWVYLNNFKDPYHPISVRLQAGKAKEFKQDMKQLVESTREEIHRVFEGDEYANKKDEILRKFQNKRSEVFQEVNEYARKNSFTIQQSPMGFETIPLKDGEPMQKSEIEQLDEEDRKELEKKNNKIQQDLKSAMRRIQKLEREANNEIKKLDQDIIRYVIEPMIEELQEKYQGIDKLNNYFREVIDAIVSNQEYFRKTQSDDQQQQADPYHNIRRERFMKQFEINVLVDNSSLNGAPVVMEQNPTYHYLFGKVEKESQFGALETNFTLIRKGALHTANEGYIIIPVLDLVSNPFSWESLIRALNNQEISVEDISEKMGFMTTKSLRPESIPLDLKVVLIGQPVHYQILYSMNNDFRKLFRVKSDFDSEMSRNTGNIRDYISFICMVCNEEKLNHLDRSGLQKLIEFGARLAGHQNKLSTRFREILDIVQEANYYSRQDESSYIQGRHIKKAFEEKIYRSNLVQEKINEAIKENTLKINVSGEKTGEINGLSVIDLGDFSFGRPNKITVSTGLGKTNVVDIEREAKLGGPIHTKGVLILSGYLMEKYSSDSPVNLSIRLVFEQSYSGIEGDSASSAEAYAILSQIAGIPIKQNLAVTGSMNQKGEIQAIGGVNEKIEGFYEVCKINGLNNNQGVIIPQANVKNLMLKEEVVNAAKERNFHIWPVNTIEEGFEILSGLSAGKRNKQGNFPEGTFNHIIVKKLKETRKKYLSFNKNARRKKTKKEKTR